MKSDNPLLTRLLNCSDPDELTYVAEDAGNGLPSEVVVPHLLKLLSHSDACVREGVVLGLATHIGFPGVQDALNKVINEDKSRAVQVAALELLGGKGAERPTSPISTT